MEYEREESVSLLNMIRHKLDLEKRIGREVDWVENGQLKAFAAPSAEQDKYLIYAR